MRASRLTQNGNAKIIGIAVLLLFFTGCIGLDAKKNVAETLEVRVDRYMEAHIKKQWDVVYTLNTPSFREKTSMVQFISRQRQISWETYKLESITLSDDGNSADIMIRTDVSMMSFTFKDAPSEQHWIKVGSDWFFEPLEQVNPFAPMPVKKKKTP